MTPRVGVRCFHSLQTGKGIQRLDYAYVVGVSEEKFPFPSNGKGYSKITDRLVEDGGINMFPFPSNGKGYSKVAKAPVAIIRFVEVSIPFKRERVFKVLIMWDRRASTEEEFPFPSNGKVYSKSQHSFLFSFLPISFPFPSNGKGYSKDTDLPLSFAILELFPFPSNGKGYSKVVDRYHDAFTVSAFPFPSNGKGYSKAGIFL